MSTGKMCNLTELLGNRIKPTNERFGLWLLLENLDSNNLVTDVGNINYTEGEDLLTTHNLEPLTPLTKPFCDNIMLVKVIDVTDCETGKNIVKKDICGAFNSHLRAKFSNFISARHGVKAKLPFPLLSDRGISKRICDIIGTDGVKNIKNKFKIPMVIPYKVELADVDMEILLKEMPEILTDLRVQDFYLLDLDITQDYIGIFNKKEMCEYLVKNQSFRYLGDEYKEGYNTIVNNDKTVGIDCLTWLTPNRARVKIYNKFICQITSPGVNKQIGNHIVDFVNCPDLRLKQTFLSSSAREHGILRMEATIYNNNGEDHPLHSCLNLLEESNYYLREAPFYSVSIPKMWTKVTDRLRNSCCVVFDNLLQYVYWGNSNTRKLTGVQITLPDDHEQRHKIINYTLSAFSFNYLPVNYLEVVEDVANKDNVSVMQKCYIKSGETFFSKSSTVFSTVSKDINLESCGLIPTKNVSPQILRKRTNAASISWPSPVKEIKPISIVYLSSAEKRKLELEEIDLKRRKLEYLENVTSLKSDFQVLQEREKTIKESRDRMVNYFNKHWKNLDILGEYKVSAFTVNTKPKYPQVGILAEKDGSLDVYYLKGIHKPWLIRVYDTRKDLLKSGFVITPYNDLDILHLPGEDPFMTFTTNGAATFNGNCFAKIERLKLLTDAWEKPENIPYSQEDIDRISDVSMREISGKVIPGRCHRLEDLEDGLELVVRAIKPVSFRKRIRYVVLFENLDPIFLSNYWLEKEIKELKLDLNYKFNVKLDKVKTTPCKKKEKVVFCV